MEGKGDGGVLLRARAIPMSIAEAKPRFTVAIPTFERPTYLGRAVRSVLVQTRVPDEVLVVHRRDDSETVSTFNALLNLPHGNLLRFVAVDEPGFLPPIWQAVQNCSGDVIVLLDDDAEAHRDWLERLSAFYVDPSIGGVGGRYVNYSNGVRQCLPSADVAGKLYWYGRFVGNMYKDFRPGHPVSVDCLIGGNMSYRVSLAKECLPARVLNHNVAFHWELDMALKIKKLGYRIVYEPGAVVDHHSAPRNISGMRTRNYEGIYCANYNFAYIIMRHSNILRRLGYIGYTAIVGEETSPGVARLALLWLECRGLTWQLITASIRGRLDGARAGLNAARGVLTLVAVFALAHGI
jgi:glycosyltransferase involved in cell wall biosynthesis